MGKSKIKAKQEEQIKITMKQAQLATYAHARRHSVNKETPSDKAAYLGS
jgi:hypothetical protein